MEDRPARRREYRLQRRRRCGHHRAKRNAGGLVCSPCQFRQLRAKARYRIRCLRGRHRPLPDNFPLTQDSNVNPSIANIDTKKIHNLQSIFQVSRCRPIAQP